jgi:hypothetical protein
MNLETVDWHYPRPDLAQNILNRYRLGMTPLTVFFAPLESGKTEFVIKDVLPAAKEFGYDSIITVNFSQNKEDPESCLLQGLTRAYNAIPSIEAKNIPSTLIQFRDFFYLYKILFQEDENAKVLFILDEIQILASSDENDNIVASIRTFLNKNEDWLHCIMTGSDKNELSRMFNRYEAPLYRAAYIEEFPPLGDAFVLYMIKCYHDKSGLKLDEVGAISTFNQLGKRPARFCQLIERMLLQGITDFNIGLGIFSDLARNK